MKKFRIVYLVIIIAGLVLGWGIFGMKSLNANSAVTQSLTAARDYTERHLYEKAYQSYTEILETNPDKEIMDEALAAMNSGVEDGEFSLSELAEAYDNARILFPKEYGYWADLLEIYVNNSQFTRAYELNKEIVRNNISNEKIQEYSRKLLYSFTIKSRTYSVALRSPTGHYTVCKDDQWGVLQTNGDPFVDTDQIYVSPLSSDFESVYIDERGARLRNSSRVVQYIFNYEPEGIMGAVNGEIVPQYSSENERWKYFDCNQEIFSDGEYEDAAAFQNGYGLVKTGGQWKFVDTDFVIDDDISFENIKLYQNREYAYLDTIVAKQEGTYRMFDANGKEINSFEAEDMDNYYGGLLAFKDESGLWGFVNRNGQIVIEPAYKEAKSFAYGLAAVSDGEAWGFIDQKGNLVIDYQFRDAGYFNRDGLCSVSNLPDSYYFILLRYPNG